MKNFKFRFPFYSNYFFVLQRMYMDNILSTTKIINNTKIDSITPSFSPLYVNLAV